MRTRFSSLRIAGSVLIGVLALACGESKPSVYTARLFHVDDSGACLDAYAPIGLVQAEELAATCEPVCLTKDGALYVSTVCPPYPDTAAVVEARDSVGCRDALGLLANEDSECK
jgi:hypothetical protein